MISKRVFDLCQVQETVSSTLAKDPYQAPGDIVKRLYGGQEHARQPTDASDTNEPVASANPLELALKCGRWGPTEPSALFLQAFADALSCLDSNPMAGVISPPLMGSHGMIPLTIVAPLQDIVRHCSNLIVRAEKEVFFITCSWSPSVAQRLIRNALIELSKRAEKRGQRVMVKIMYDKPSIGNIFSPHQRVKPKTFTSNSVQLPAPEEVPFLDMEVISLHRLILGTLHAKFCIVDRKIAAIMSNNIEDNDNMEMMTHLEGPVVESIYDTALITWNNPLRAEPPSPKGSVAEGGSLVSTQDLRGLDILDHEEKHHDTQIVSQDRACPELPEHTPESPHDDDDIAGEIVRMQSCYSNKSDETRLQATNRQLNLAVKNPIQPTGPDIQDGEEMTPYIETFTTEPVPIALACRPPYGPINSKSLHVPQNEAWLSLIRNARRDIFIQTPDLNAGPLMTALADALKRGVEVTYYVCWGYNDTGEMVPGQGGTNEQAARALINGLPPAGPERDILHIYHYVGKDQDHPIHNSFKSRSCHVKLLIADGAVGIQGSGNQDTQSWFHSQEVNIIVDSYAICQQWRKAIDRNQNTRVFGRVIM
ncbi:hypothetical protein Neosp_013113 [[Neocosmospora] mangrovei]